MDLPIIVSTNAAVSLNSQGGGTYYCHYNEFHTALDCIKLSMFYSHVLQGALPNYTMSHSIWPADLLDNDE